MAKNPLGRNARRLALLACAGLLASCFGGIGDGEVEAYKRGVNASGIWFGTVDVDNEAQNIGAILIAAPDGTLYMDTDVGALMGEAGTRGNAFIADTIGYSYQLDFPDGANFSLNAVVNEQSSMNGAFSGSARSGIFQFRYDPELSTQAAAVQTIAGTYDSQVRIRNSTGRITVTIGPYGEFTGGDTSGCMFTGTVEVLDSPHNLYQWQATPTGCAVGGTASGIGIGQDGASGRGFLFVGSVDGGGIDLMGFNGPGPSLLAPGSFRQFQ